MGSTSQRKRAVDAVTAWIKKYRAAMVAVARKQGWGEDAAEDIAQEAALRALDIARDNPERLGAVTSHRRWLCGIAWNIGRSTRAKIQRRKGILREKSDDIREELYAWARPNGGVEGMSEDLWHLCKTVLSPRQVEVMRLILTGDMTDAEIAIQLHLSTATVRWHRNEATRALRHLFHGGR